MDELNTFERQVARDALRDAGPSRPVDPAAVFARAVTTTQSPKWRFQSMFSATKFLVAGAIVALFGGFLLSGVLTQQPSDDTLPAVGASASVTPQAEPTDTATSEPEPTAEVDADGTTTTPDLLPGVDLVTEEVEPGVYRVLSDGVDDLSDVPDLEVPATMASDGECWAFLVEGECWANAYGMLVREVDGEFPLEQVPDAEHGLTFPAQEVIGPLPGSGDTGWLIITGPTGFQGLLGYDAEGWTRVPYSAGEDGRALWIDADRACGVVLGPERYPGLVGPDGTVWVYTLEPEGLQVTAWDGESWSTFGPLEIGAPDVEDPCLLLDTAFGPNGTMWFTTRRIPLYVITSEAVAE